ncbi:MAG: hypothetical protein FWE13_03935 [Firmicutes bacterium]|nr:hypothetical protein [Bacillota bacterium]
MTKKKRLIIIFSALLALTALIIINSAVFSVRSVNANALNESSNNESVLRINDLIANNHGIRMGSSIFMLNEERTIEAVTRNILEQDGAVANFEIRSLERIFPNRIVVHYVLLLPYFYIETVVGADVKVFSNNGTLIDILPILEAQRQGAIRLDIRGQLLSLERGSRFETDYPRDTTRFFAVIDAFERMYHHFYMRHEDISMDFRYVDISDPRAIFLRMLPGVKMEIRNETNFIEYFRHGFSVYRHLRRYDSDRTLSGRIRPYRTATGEFRIVYSEE